MIKVFGQTDKDFSSNGDIVLRPFKARVRKEDAGDYYLALETGIEYADYFVEGNIVTANTPQGDQAFRISNVTKTKTKITTKAWHVFYDSENYLIADSYVVEKNCNDALNHLNNATEPLSEFQVSSDVVTVNSYRCVRASLYEAIQTVLERWGGHLVRDNFKIEIKSDIGTDNGVTVEYKKNLKDITCEEDWSEVVTKLLPVGKDGLLLNAVNPSASIYMESDIQYAIPYCKTVSFEQDDILEEDYPTEQAYIEALVADLAEQAEAYLKINSIPQINYSLKANLDKITDIGDVVEVKDKRLGIDLLTHVIAFEYDCILEQYTEIEFGNFKPTLSGLVGNITTSIDKSVSEQISGATANTNAQFAEIVTSPAKKAFAKGEYVVFNDIFCKVTLPISVGDLLIIGTNLESISVGDALEEKQGLLTAGTGIDIANDEISTKKSDLIDMIYPIGSLYMSVSQTSPASLFGGTWSQIKDTFILACGDTYSAGSTGGEASHTLTVDEMPSHTHDIEYSSDGTTYSDAVIGKAGSSQSSSNFAGSDSIDSQLSYRIKATGGGQAHNNMPPYLAIYVWKRTA